MLQPELPPWSCVGCEGMLDALNLPGAGDSSFSSCRDQAVHCDVGAMEQCSEQPASPPFFTMRSVACLVGTNTCQRNVKRVGSVPFGDQPPSGHPGDLEVSPASPLCKWPPLLPPGVNLREKEGLVQWISTNSRNHSLFSSYLPLFLLSFISFLLVL